MIGYLEGEVLFSEEQKLILKTNHGIGYQVFFEHTLVPGNKVELYITQIVRETELSLYGFKHYKEKKIFELLLGVNGVGPKSAYSLITNVGPDEVIDAIVLEQIDVLKKANGIGKKAASQIILSLKDKIKTSASAKSIRSSLDVSGDDSNGHIFDDALLALQALGYKEATIVPVLRGHLKGCESSQDLIKAALKSI